MERRVEMGTTTEKISRDWLRGPREAGHLYEVTQADVWRQDRVGRELQDVSNAMVRIYKELFGRGPTKARSDYAGPDALVVTLENSFTRAERNMIAVGEHRRVQELRTLFQRSSERDFVVAVERITGRKVRALVGGTDTHEDVSSKVFYFEPVAGA